MSNTLNVESTINVRPGSAINLHPTINNSTNNRMPSTAFDVRLEISERKIRAIRRPRTSPLNRHQHNDSQKQKLMLVGSGASPSPKYFLDESYCAPADEQSSVDKDLNMDSVDSEFLPESKPHISKKSKITLPRPKSSKILPKNLPNGQEKKYPFRPFSAIVQKSNTNLSRQDSHVSIHSEFSLDAGNSMMSDFNGLHEPSLSTLEPEITAVELPAPRRLPEKDTFFYDMWVASQGGIGGDFNSFNVDLMSKFQTLLTDINTEYQGKEKTNNPLESTKHNWDSKYIKYLKSLGAAGFAALDILIKEIGHRYPILVDLRDSLLPALYHSKIEEVIASDEASNNPYKLRAEVNPDNEQIRDVKDFAMMVAEYNNHLSYVEKWFQDAQNGLQAQKMYETLLQSFHSTSEELSVTHAELAEKKSSLDKAQRSRDKYFDELSTLRKETDALQAELTKLKSQWLQEKNNSQALESSYKALSKDYEELKIAITFHELTIKEMEGKLQEYSSALEKSKKETLDLTRERRDLKQELGELQDSTKRQSVVLNAERVRTKEMVSTVHDLLYNAFQSFVDVVAPDEVEQETKDSTDVLSKLFNHSRTIIARVNSERMNLQDNNTTYKLKNGELSAELEKTKKDSAEYISKLQLDHRQEIQNLTKSHAAIQENLRKAGLKKEVEKTALQSMLHAVREEASALRAKIKELIDDYETRLKILNEEKTLLTDRLLMKTEDLLTICIINRLTGVIEDKTAEIHDLESKLEHSRAACNNFERRLLIKEKELTDFMDASELKLLETNNFYSIEVATRDSTIFLLKEYQMMLKEDADMHCNRRITAERKLVEQIMESQKLKMSFEAKLCSALNELANTFKDKKDGDCQTDIPKETFSVAENIKDPISHSNLNILENETDFKTLMYNSGPNDAQKTVSISKSQDTVNSSDESSAESDSDAGDASDAYQKNVSNRVENLQRNVRRNATFFDKQYIPVETNHFNNPDAWRYLAERLSEEKTKFQGLVSYLNQEKKKIKNDMMKFSKMIEDLKIKLPQQILLHVNQISRINLTHIISSEINRRVSTIHVPGGSPLSSPIQLTSINEQSDEAASPQNSTHLSTLEAKELIKVGKSLSKVLGLKGDNKGRSKGISFEMGDSTLEEDEDDDEASERRKALLQIEYAHPEKMRKKEALRSLIKSKYMNKGTQTTGISYSKTSVSAVQALQDPSSSDPTKIAVENTMRALFPHRFRADLQTGPEKIVSPHQLSQPFLGFIRKNEKVFSRECGLLKVALRECKAYFDKLLNHVILRMNTIAAANVNPYQKGKALSRQEKDLSKLKLRNVREQLNELRDIQSSIQSHQWLFDSKLFIRKLCDHPFEDPIDVASQSQILSSYQELLLTERQRHQQLIASGQDCSSSEAVIRTLEDLITDITVRIHSNGGWRSLFYRTDGTFDVDLDPSGFPLEEQVHINAEKFRYLQRKLSSTTEEHDRVVASLQNEIATLQEYILELKASASLEGHQPFERFDDEAETNEQGCNTDCNDTLIVSATTWENILSNLRLLSSSVIDNFHLSALALSEANEASTRDNFDEKSSIILSNLNANADLDEIERSKKLKSMAEVASLVTQNRKTPILPSMNSLDDKYVSFVNPLFPTKSRPYSASGNAQSTPAAFSSSSKLGLDGKGKSRPWTSNAWRQLENTIKMNGGGNENTTKKSSLELCGIPKTLENHEPSRPRITKLISLLDQNDNDRVSVCQPILTELLQLSAEIKDVLLLSTRQKLKNMDFQNRIISKRDFHNGSTNIQSLKNDEGLLPLLAHNPDLFRKEDKSLVFDDEGDFGNQKYNHASSVVGVGENALDCHDSAVLLSSPLRDGLHKSASTEPNPHIDPEIFSSHALEKPFSSMKLDQASKKLQDPILFVDSFASTKEENIPNASHSQKSELYEKLMSSVYKLTQERKHSDVMKYALVMYDRYQQHHEEAKKMKEVLVTLQNSHHVFEDQTFLTMVQKHQKKKHKHDRDSSFSLRAPISTEVDPKKYKQYLDKKHKGFTRSHVSIHATELSVPKVANDDRQHEKFGNNDSVILDSLDPMVSLEVTNAFDTHTNSHSSHSKKKSKVYQCIEVARQHYDNPLSAQSSTLDITEAVETLSFDKPPTVRLEKKDSRKEDEKRFEERQVRNQATQWSKTLSDIS